MTGQLDWLRGGLLLALAFFLAVLLVKPIGVSTQFVIFDGIVWQLFDQGLVREDAAAKSGYASDNAYLDKSGGKYAAEAAHPFNYSFIFVLAIMGGAYLSSRLGGPRAGGVDRTAPRVWRERYGGSPTRRYAAAFAGGFLVLFGARLAGGCTSGHMMSGMMQTSLSGYLFAAGAFVIAVPVAIALYGRRGEVQQ